MKKLIAFAATAAALCGAADVRLPEYGQVAEIRSLVAQGVQPSLANIQATLEALKIEFAKNRIATLTIRLNPDGSGYELPTDPDECAALLDGAFIQFDEQGIPTPLTASLTSLTNAVWEQTLYVTDASSVAPSRISARLGESATAGYGVAAKHVTLHDGGSYTVDLVTRALTNSLVAVARIQPNSGAGESFLGVKTATANGTEWRTGHYEGSAWVDGSLVKTVIYDCPDGAAPAARILEDGDGAGGANSVDLRETLDALRNLKIVYADFISGATTIASNQFVRFPKVWMKTARENVPIVTVTDNVPATNHVDCVVKYFADAQLDPEYHLPAVFERYETQPDGSVATYQRDYAYIARFPIQTQSVSIGGVSKAVARSLPDDSTEVGATRAGFLAYCRNVNLMDVRIYAPGEDGEIYVAANTDPRLASMAGVNDDAFLSSLSYLLLGANPQGDISAAGVRILPGKCTATGVTSTKNGETEYIVKQGVWNGAKDTQSIGNSIVVWGVEDGTWSSTGWMWPDITHLERRTLLTDATGAVTNDTLKSGLIFCQDRLLYNPCSSSANYNNTTATEAELLLNGYRWADFAFPNASAAGMKRLGTDSSACLRDAFIPTSESAATNIRVGSDYVWSAAQATPGNYSTTASYAAGAYCKYNGLLYRCNTASPAGAWDDSKWVLQTSAAVELRSWFVTARGYHRNGGSYLGLGAVTASYPLSTSNGYNWRARLSLQP